ncbi:MAG: hypothetical protein FJZ04_01240 [Candidatus Moranbacteria bacterium]|nr:hypothetical protein [Candidatus Moranbacteria bacterium]
MESDQEDRCGISWGQWSVVIVLTSMLAFVIIFAPHTGPVQDPIRDQVVDLVGALLKMIK